MGTLLDNYSGYTGNFKQPLSDLSLYGPTIYGVSDINKQELDLILLTPGCFYDAYKIIKQIGFIDVKIFIPSLDVLYISDIFNLIMDIAKYKPTIQWVFPLLPQIPTSTLFEAMQLKNTFYQNSIDSNITIEYIPSEIAGRSVYDILVKDGNKTRYFCQYLSTTKLDLLYDLETIDEIHIPYTSTLYGGLDYMDAISIDKKYASKLVANDFCSVDEYLYAKETKVNLGKFISNAFHLNGIRGVIDYTTDSI